MGLARLTFDRFCLPRSWRAKRSIRFASCSICWLGFAVFDERCDDRRPTHTHPKDARKHFLRHSPLPLQMSCTTIMGLPPQSSLELCFQAFPRYRSQSRKHVGRRRKSPAPRPLSNKANQATIRAAVMQATRPIINDRATKQTKQLGNYATKQLSKPTAPDN